MSVDQTSIVELVQQVKAAIQGVQAASSGSRISITKVGLELKTVLKRELSGEAKLQIIPLGVAGGQHQEQIQVIGITLVPRPVTKGVAGSVAEELAEAIGLIRTAVKEAAESPPAYGLEEATVSLSFGVTKKGKIAIFVGGAIESACQQTVKLTIRNLADG